MKKRPIAYLFAFIVTSLLLLQLVVFPLHPQIQLRAPATVRTHSSSANADAAANGVFSFTDLSNPADANIYRLQDLLSAVHRTNTTLQQARAGYMHALATSTLPATSNYGPVTQHRRTLVSGSKPLHNPGETAASTLMSAALELLNASSHLLVCGQQDPSLPSANETFSGDRYLIAANLFQSEGMLPNFVLQLITLALEAPTGSLSFSIYESGSTDKTSYWLDILRLLLAPLCIPQRIITNGTLVKTPDIERIEFLASVRNAAIEPFFDSKQQGLCESSRMATACCSHVGAHANQHNGFHNTGSTGSDGSSSNQQDLAPSIQARQRQTAVPTVAGTTSRPGNASHGSRNSNGLLCHSVNTAVQGPAGRAARKVPLLSCSHPACFKPNYILFLNDVFFCKSDLLRLLQYKDADLACGFDFYGPYRKRSSRRQLLQQAHTSSSSSSDDRNVGSPHQPLYTVSPAAQHAAAHALQSQPALLFGNGIMQPQLPKMQPMTSSMQRSLQADTPNAMPSVPQDQVDNYTYLYWDQWVGRLVNGKRVEGRPLWTSTHAPTARRWQQGLPAQVYCCWNGAAKLRAEPFYKGLRFRAHLPGECMASECSLLCDDLHRLEYSRVLVDPRIGMAYTYGLATKLREQPAPYMQQATWKDVQSSGSYWSYTPEQLGDEAYTKMECCDLLPGQHHVDWDTACHPYNILHRNFTAHVLGQQSVFGKLWQSLPCG